MNQKHQWNTSGYNAEELYFEKLNRELIHKLNEDEKLGELQQTAPPHGPGAQIIAFPLIQSQRQKKAA
jgi:hypothetical protein